MEDQTAMKYAAILVGCVVAFAGGWGGILLASLFTHKAGAGWGLSRYAVLLIIAVALLGVAAGSAAIRGVGQTPARAAPSPAVKE